MGGHKTKSILIGISFFLIRISVSLQAYELVPFYLYDPNNPTPNAGKAPSVLDPCNPWSIPPEDANGLKVGPVKPGKVVYLAFNNFRDPKREKRFRLELKRASGSLGRVYIELANGYADANGNVPIEAIPTGNINRGDNEMLRQDYRFKQQPRWERFRLINKTSKDVSFYVKAWSVCGIFTGDWNMFRIEQGSFGAEGAMISSEPIKQVHCFAESTDLDGTIMPVMTSQMPGSGPWIPQPIFVDPEGKPRPHGGVRFFTIGTGLIPGALFDLFFAMKFPPDQEKDVHYFIYTLDEDGKWDNYVIDLAGGLCDGEILHGDINKDCKVDLIDLAELAGNWLMCNDPLDLTCQF